MKQLITAFDRAYIINLQDRPDRRHDAVREFKRIGLSIPCEKVRFYTATRPTEVGEFPSLGARGAFSSHRHVLEMAIRDGLRNLLVCEDDVNFRSVGSEFIKALCEDLFQREWDLVILGYNEPSDRELVGPLTQWDGPTKGTHFFAVNGRFIGRMLDYMREVEMRPRNHPMGGPTSADGIYNRIRLENADIRVLLSCPKLAYQRSSRTDLRPPRSFDNVAALEPLVRFGRRIKDKIRMGADAFELWRHTKHRQKNH
jgi:glycosyl transferase family 25